MTEYKLPQWAPRIHRAKVLELYRKNADGIFDEDLIEEIGISFLARCMSIVEATAAHRGQVKCVTCSHTYPRIKGPDRTECPKCGWSVPWTAYHKTYRRKQLIGGAFLPFAKAYIEDYPKARSPEEKMTLIDILIHRYHGELQDGARGYRAGVIGLVGGKQPEIKQFLDDLAEGRFQTEEQRRQEAAWVDKVRKQQDDV